MTNNSEKYLLKVREWSQNSGTKEIKHKTVYYAIQDEGSLSFCFKGNPASARAYLTYEQAVRAKSIMERYYEGQQFETLGIDGIEIVEAHNAFEEYVTRMRDYLESRPVATESHMRQMECEYPIKKITAIPIYI